MVVYTQVPSSRGNNYWKLRDITSTSRIVADYELGVKGVRPGKRIFGPERAKILSRVERGLVYYKPCSKRQLAVFCKQRCVELPSAKPKKADMIQALEEADEDQTFSRFAQLPPELRAYIFELYFRSFEMLCCPGLPPVTQSSRLFRQEALPLFYKTCTFAIHVADHELLLDRPRGSLKHGGIFSEETTNFLRHTSNRNLAWVRLIDISGMVTRGEDRQGRQWTPLAYGRWRIDLAARSNERVARMYFTTGSSPSPQLVEEKLSQAVEAMVENSISSRAGIRKLAEAFHDDEAKGALC